jgi:hypothetical protein
MLPKPPRSADVSAVMMRPNDNYHVLEGGKNGASDHRGDLLAYQSRKSNMSRSVRFREFGASEILKIEDVVVPNPGPKEIRLRIKAFGLERIHALQYPVAVEVELLRITVHRYVFQLAHLQNSPSLAVFVVGASSWISKPSRTKTNGVAR